MLFEIDNRNVIGVTLRRLPKRNTVVSQSTPDGSGPGNEGQTGRRKSTLSQRCCRSLPLPEEQGKVQLCVPTGTPAWGFMQKLISQSQNGDTRTAQEGALLLSVALINVYTLFHLFLTSSCYCESGLSAERICLSCSVIWEYK